MPDGPSQITLCPLIADLPRAVLKGLASYILSFLLNTLILDNIANLLQIFFLSDCFFLYVSATGLILILRHLDYLSLHKDCIPGVRLGFTRLLGFFDLFL